MATATTIGWVAIQKRKERWVECNNNNNNNNNSNENKAHDTVDTAKLAMV